MIVFAGLVILHAVGARFHTYPGPQGAPGLLLVALAPAGLAVLALGSRHGEAPASNTGPLRIAATLAVILATLGAASVPILLDQPTDDASDTSGTGGDYYPG